MLDVFLCYLIFYLTNVNFKKTAQEKLNFKYLCFELKLFFLKAIVLFFFNFYINNHVHVHALNIGNKSGDFDGFIGNKH